MKNEPFFKLPALLRSKKEILWLGFANEIPPKSLNSLLSKVEFVTNPETVSPLSKDQFSVLVMSVQSIEQKLDVSLLELAKQDKIEKLLILPEGMQIHFSKIEFLLCKFDFKQVLVLPRDQHLILPCLEQALLNSKNHLNERAVVSLFKNQNIDIESKNIDLESVMQEREKTAVITKCEIDKKLSSTKGLVNFIKDLSYVTDVGEVMQLLRLQLKKFHKVKEPILGFANSNGELSLVFFQGIGVVEKTLVGAWPQQIRIRINSLGDSQFLANIFGRPFAKLLTIPLLLKRKSNQDTLKVSAVLFFEHDLNSVETPDFLQFIEDRLQPISIALDRLLLEQDLKEASLLWEKTFDGLLDPVAIFDSEKQILRANKSFSENMQSLSVDELMAEIVNVKGKFFKVQSYPISLGEAGRSTNWINHYVDITAARKLHNQMVQNEKMAALGHLAGHIAHELNNPLTGIRSLTQLLLKQNANGGTIFSDLQEVEKAAERCQIIIKNLLEFSSGGLESRITRISINDVVNKTLPLLKTLISRFKIETTLTTKQCEVLVEPHLMQQVVFNIIKNAAQSMGTSGTLTIQTDILSTKEVVLRIKDTGCGIAPGEKEKIFDFFYTTKATASGTGIGLSMSKSIVDRFGGNITVNSELGHGTEFIIALPELSGQ